MELWQKIHETYPEMQSRNFEEFNIVLRDDSDGQGAYIEKWEYTKPLPEGMKVGKN